MARPRPRAQIQRLSQTELHRCEYERPPCFVSVFPCFQMSLERFEQTRGGRCGDWREGLPSSLAEAARYNGACHMMYKPAKKEDDRAQLVKLR